MEGSSSDSLPSPLDTPDYSGSLGPDINEYPSDMAPTGVQAEDVFLPLPEGPLGPGASCLHGYHSAMLPAGVLGQSIFVPFPEGLLEPDTSFLPGYHSSMPPTGVLGEDVFLPFPEGPLEPDTYYLHGYHSAMVRTDAEGIFPPFPEGPMIREDLGEDLLAYSSKENPTSPEALQAYIQYRPTLPIPIDSPAVPYSSERAHEADGFQADGNDVAFGMVLGFGVESYSSSVTPVAVSPFNFHAAHSLNAIKSKDAPQEPIVRCRHCPFACGFA